MKGKVFLKGQNWYVQYNLWDDDTPHTLPVHLPMPQTCEPDQEVSFEIYMDKNNPELKYAKIQP